MTDDAIHGVSRRELHHGWTVSALDGRQVPEAVRRTAKIPASVPGTVHTDLLAAGLIDDPYLDDNERLQAWIGSASWRYNLVFDWSDDGADEVELVFDGLDTIATVRLNGEPVLKSRNQHRSYRVPVRDVLRDGANALEVDFAAPIAAADLASLELGARPHVNHHPYNAIRKMASSFGWDWGIDTSTSGIWRPVRLESWSTARIADLRVVPRVEGGDGVATVTALLSHTAATPLRLRARIDEKTVEADVAAGADRVELELRVPGADLWWPRGYGEPRRYRLEVELVADDVVLDERSLAIGFRTVETDTTPDEHGTPFRIVVNGQPVYVRGVNWIPDDAFPHRIDRPRYQQRIAQAEFAGANLIRVWGGGIYESEDFYDLCDERGMLTWQDFLLACAAYAEEEPLRSEIEAEAREAIVRIAAHPSLVLFNGNNENLEGFGEWGWPLLLDGATWGGHYYHELFPALVAELAPHVPYIPGSPFSPGEVSRPNDPKHGPVHIWDLWNERDWVDYRNYTPRFVAEFGWQGPPTWSTLTRAIHDEPLSPVSPGMLVHQKAMEGNTKLTRGLVRHFAVPGAMRDWVWAMQLNQAIAVRTALEHFRSLSPRCMGTIVWQLNDDWPVTSWAAIDGDGRAKPLLYGIRHAYADRLATIQPRDGGLAVVLVNDTADEWAGELDTARFRFDGERMSRHSVHVVVAPRATVSVRLPPYIAESIRPGAEFVRATLGAVRADWFFAEYRDSELQPRELELSVRESEDGLVVDVTARTLTRDLTLLVDTLAPDAAVDDGLITLLPGETARFAIRTTSSIDAARLSEPSILVTANDLVAGVPEGGGISLAADPVGIQK